MVSVALSAYYSIERTLGWHAPQNIKIHVIQYHFKSNTRILFASVGGLKLKYNKSIERLHITMTRYIRGYSKAVYNERLLHLYLSHSSKRRDINDVIFI